MMTLNTLGRKIGFGYALMALMLTVAVGTTVWQTHKSGLIFDELRELRVPTTQTSLSMLNGVNESLASLRGWVILGKDKFREERRQAWDEKILPDIKKLETLMPHWNLQEDKNRIILIRTKLRTFAHYQQEIEEIAHTPENTPALKLFINEVQPLAYRLITSIRKMIMTEEGRLREQQAQTLDFVRITLFEDIINYQSGTERLLVALESYLLTGNTKELKKYRRAVETNQGVYQLLREDDKLFSLEEKRNFYEI